MQLDLKVKKQIIETKYLATENTWRYRSIIRIMYKKYEKMKYDFYKEDILEELKKYEDFIEYNIDLLKGDLDSLVQWGNLLAVADTTKVRTLEEFKNKKFRYQLSPYSVEIERMLIRLENINIEANASLEGSLVERFRMHIENIENIRHMKNSQVHEWWKELSKSFKALNENYQDYISKFYSPQNEELMKTTEFLLFKEGFITYLRDFIKELQFNASIIREKFLNIDKECIEEILAKVLSHEKSIPQVDFVLNEEDFLDNNRGRLQSMKEWFVGESSKKALWEQLMDNTNEIIRKITRFASQISDKRSSNINRKEEYKKIANMFYNCNSIEESNKLSSLVFGVFSPRHIKGNIERETESINSSIYEEKPFEVITKPRVRNYREKTAKKIPIKDKKEQKESRLKLVLQKREREKEIAEEFIKDNILDFSKLPEIEGKQRAIFLRWLSKGKNSKNNRGKTEYGREYEIIEPQKGEEITLHCEDGNFIMPAYIIRFKSEE